MAYYLGAEAAFLIGTLSDRIFAPFWPPNAILFCALAVLPYRRWPLYIIAVFPAHAIAELGVGMGWSQLVVAFVTNCIVCSIERIRPSLLVGSTALVLQLADGHHLCAGRDSLRSRLSALGGAFVCA
jgi:integral membrane sensor domain MASE1